MEKIKILLVEDDELASEIIYNFLEECDFSVTAVFSATDSVAYIKNESYDIVILDINLPDFTGFEVLKSIGNYISLPIIVTSARNDTESKLLAFKYNASDYLVKPIDLRELEARIWVQLRKNTQISIETDSYCFERKGTTIYFKKIVLDLTTIEFEILSHLLQNKNTIVKREDLLRITSRLSSPRSLDNHIKNIRKKIGDNGNNAQYLKTEYGIGYKLVCS